MDFAPPPQVFSRGSCLRGAGLCPASWPWARGLCGRHPSPPLSPAWGSCGHRWAGSASAFTTRKEMPIRKEPLRLCLSAHILSGGCWLLAVHPFRSNSALSRALAVKIKLISQFLFYGFVKDFFLASDIILNSLSVVVYIITISATVFQVRS